MLEHPRASYSRILSWTSSLKRDTSTSLYRVPSSSIIGTTINFSWWQNCEVYNEGSANALPVILSNHTLASINNHTTNKFPQGSSPAFTPYTNNQLIQEQAKIYHASTMSGYAPQGNSSSTSSGGKKSGSGKQGGSTGNNGGSGGKGSSGGGSSKGGSGSYGGKRGGGSERDSWEEAARDREMRP
ncbi:hypothetical protein F4680DRAFT_423289 [Xylaria scruposa]|nr:hypothetical protein F4680DRAFT_423289 [Xylaria scruposa]